MKKPTVKSNQITEGVIWKQLLLFCFPIILGTLFQQMYNAADVIVVGQFVGKEALACVGGSSGTIINLIVGFFVGLSSGTTVIVSRAYGAGKTEELNKAVHASLALSIVGGIILMAVGLIWTPKILEMMDTPKEVMSGSILYLRIYFGGILFVFIYNIGSAILRAMGDSRKPLYYLIICCFINIFLDVVLVVVFKMGVAGVAIATVTAQAVSAILTVSALMKMDTAYNLILKKISFHKEVLFSIIWIGLPAGFQSVMNSIAGIIMQAAVNGLGTNAVAGNTAYAKLDAIFWMISGAFSVSISTFVGQNYGAGKYDRMRRSVWVCLGLDVLVSGGLSILFMTCGRYLLYLFTADVEVINSGLQVLQAIAPYYVLVAFYEIFTSALRGMGDVAFPMVMNILGLCVVRILWILIAVPYFHDLYHIILSCPVSWAATALMISIYYGFRYREKEFYFARCTFVKTGFFRTGEENQ